MTATILYLLAFILFIISFFKDKEKTFNAFKIALKSFENIMPQFLSIIFIIGAILSFINATTISNLIGESSGFLGILFSSIIGSITIMPTFVAFSTCSTLLQNGAGFAQIGALVSTLTLVGIMTFTLESKYIGGRAAFLRNFIAFLFSFIVAIILGKVMLL
ncbi:MAG: permease [Clostridium sp.]|uniref:permease n=1 Tax=Clostridium sp. TaxID=1506 RepID=UPI003F31031F